MAKSKSKEKREASLKEANSEGEVAERRSPLSILHEAFMNSLSSGEREVYENDDVKCVVAFKNYLSKLSDLDVAKMVTQ